MNKGKEPAESSKTALFRPSTTYKSVFQKDEKSLREEALKTTPKEDQLSDEAYKLAVKITSSKEYVYPYIPISTLWVCPIERKYGHLAAEEVMTFYLKNFSEPYLYPKDYQYYQDILSYTGSVQFDSALRTGKEWAFSKASIKRVLGPEHWEGDLFKSKEININSKNPYRNKILYNYFDYIKAWEISLYYENKQRRHSWFIQFREQCSLNFPNWFIVWFSNFGLYPIIMPQKVKRIYDEFRGINPSMKCPTLMFAVLYQVPWILKWEVIVGPRTLKRLELSFENIPYIGRVIQSKWWDKYEFFKESIFSEKGLINLEVTKVPIPPSPKRDISDLIKELVASSSKRDLKNQLKAILDSDSESDEELMSISTEKSDEDKTI